MDGPDEFQPLMDEVFRDQPSRARSNPPDEKRFSGLELFEEIEERMRAGGRHQFSAAPAAEVERTLSQRFARLRQIEEHGIYQPVA